MDRKVKKFIIEVEEGRWKVEVKELEENNDTSRME